MGIDMRAGDEFARKEKSALSLSILRIFEARLIVFLAVNLSFQSNRIAVVMQSTHKLSVTLWAFCWGRQKPRTQSSEVFNGLVDGAFDDGMEVIGHVIREVRVSLQSLSQSKEFQVA